MLVKPSALTNSRLASEYWHSTPSFGFQLGMRWRCAWAAAAADMAVRTVRRGQRSHPRFAPIVPRWFRSCPAIVSTTVWNVISPRSGWVNFLPKSSGATPSEQRQVPAPRGGEQVAAPRADRASRYGFAQASWSNGWITWCGSASACRRRKPKTISQSARWQRIAPALHLPGAGCASVRPPRAAPRARLDCAAVFATPPCAGPLA